MSRYRTSLDRVGWALVTGGMGVGSGVTLIAAAGGGRGPADLAGAWLVGSGLGMLAIAALGGPVWWLAERRGRRGPLAAGLAGAGVAGVATLAVLALGFGAGFGAGRPGADAATQGALWTSAAATAAVAAFLGGLTALAMWLVAYRPIVVGRGRGYQRQSAG